MRERKAPAFSIACLLYTSKCKATLVPIHFCPVPLLPPRQPGGHVRKPLAFAALRVTTSSVALVDAVGRRPRWSCVTAAVRKRKRSGKRPAHRAGQRMQSQICLAPRTVCGCSPDAVCRGGSVGRGTAPALSGVFLPRFFLRRRRKNRAPGGR